MDFLYTQSINLDRQKPDSTYSENESHIRNMPRTEQPVRMNSHQNEILLRSAGTRDFVLMGIRSDGNSS